MTQEQWKDLVYNQIDSETIDGQMMKCLAQLPDLMYRGRCASKISALPVSTLPSLQVEVRTLSDSFRPTLTNLRERWRDTDSSIAMRYPEHMNLRGIIHAHYSRSYGMALALGIILNCMVAALEDKTPELSEDSSQMVDEVLNLARTVDQYRPLGTLYMVLCLGAAWVGATDSIRKAMLETLLINYHKDLHGASSTFFPHGLKLMETLFTLK